MTLEDFSKDSKTVDAVIRNFEVIGEASRQLSQEVKAKYTNIDWKIMTDFRNVIIHEYLGINIKIIWDIIKNELPVLEKELRKIKKNWSK